MKPQKRAESPKPTTESTGASLDKPRLPPPSGHAVLQTGEYAPEVVDMGDEFQELSEDESPSPPASAGAVRSEEEGRYRRRTVVSPISAQLAQSMGTISETPHERDPAAPLAEGDDVTRRVVAADVSAVVDESGPGYTVEVLDEGGAGRDQLADATVASPADAAAVGPLSRVPFLTRVPEEILARPLPDGAATLIDQVDGTRTLEQLFADSGLSTRDAFRITAMLLRDGIIRLAK